MTHDREGTTHWQGCEAVHNHAPAGAAPAQGETDVMRRELLSALAMAVRRLQALAPDSHALKVAEGIWRKYAKGTDILRSPANAPAATVAVSRFGEVDTAEPLVPLSEISYWIKALGKHTAPPAERPCRQCLTCQLEAVVRGYRNALPATTDAGAAESEDGDAD